LETTTFFSGTTSFGTSGALKILVFQHCEQLPVKINYIYTEPNTFPFLPPSNSEQPHVPLAGGTSGFLGTTRGTFFSGTTSLGTSGTLKDISSF
jgi:hypothetical protein